MKTLPSDTFAVVWSELKAWGSFLAVLALVCIYNFFSSLSFLLHLLPPHTTKAIRAAFSRLGSGVMYDTMDYWWEVRHYHRWREEHFCSGVSGQCLELGVGTGRNLPHYPAGTHVVGIDLSEEQLVVARQAVASGELDCTAELIRADASNLRGVVASGSSDFVVSTFLFCVCPEHLISPTLDEIARVMKPGASFRLADIQYSESPGGRRVQEFFAPYVEAVFGARFDGKVRQKLAEHKLLKVTRQVALKSDTHWMIEGVRI